MSAWRDGFPIAPRGPPMCVLQMRNDSPAPLSASCTSVAAANPGPPIRRLSSLRRLRERLGLSCVSCLAPSTVVQ